MTDRGGPEVVRASEWLENPAALKPAKALVRDLLAELQAARVNEGEAMLVVESAEYKLAAAESALHRLREVAAAVVAAKDTPITRREWNAGLDALRAELEGSDAASLEGEQ